MADYLNIDGIPFSYNLIQDAEVVSVSEEDGGVTGENQGGAIIEIAPARVIISVTEGPLIYFKRKLTGLTNASIVENNAVFLFDVIRSRNSAIPLLAAFDRSRMVYFGQANTYIGGGQLATRNYAATTWNVLDHTTQEVLGTITPSIPSQPDNGEIDASVWNNFYGYHIDTDVDIVPVMTNAGGVTAGYQRVKYAPLPWVVEQTFDASEVS